LTTPDIRNSQRTATASSRMKQRLDEIKDASRTQQEKQDVLTDIDWFEKTNINIKKLNRYPNVCYEEALHYDERFAEHLA